MFAAERGIPVIVNIHNVELARRFASRVVGMSGGRVVYDGPPQALTEAHLEADLRRRELDGMSNFWQPSSNRPKPFSANWGARIGWCLLAVYLVYACSQLGFSAERFSAGLEHGQRFVARMFPPNFGRWQLIASGIAESLQIAVIATFAGVLLSLPIGLMAARNLMPPWISWPTRGFIALCRSFHPIIVAILFVKAIGFGALAGVMAP